MKEKKLEHRQNFVHCGFVYAFIGTISNNISATDRYPTQNSVNWPTRELLHNHAVLPT